MSTVINWRAYSRDNTGEIKELHCDYSIVSDFLIPSQITKQTGIKPTKSWSKGEIYQYKGIDPKTGEVIKGHTKHMNGIWRVSTQNKVKSLYVNDHIAYVLKIIEPSSQYFKKLCNKKGYWVTFGVFRDEYCNQSSFLISAENMKRMSELCQEIRILCPVTYEEESTKPLSRRK